MTDIAFCQLKSPQVLKKARHFYEWLVMNVTFAFAKGQTPSFTVTIQNKQLIKNINPHSYSFRHDCKFPEITSIKFKNYVHLLKRKA